MLVSKSNRPQTNDIVAIKLTSGEEVVGKMVSGPDDVGIRLAKPIVVQLQMLKQGEAAIGFAPFMLARDDDDEYQFQSSALVTTPGKARDDIRINYLKATTGLEIPTAGPSSLIMP
jgi:hypothetical protein